MVLVLLMELRLAWVLQWQLQFWDELMALTWQMQEANGIQDCDWIDYFGGLYVWTLGCCLGILLCLGLICLVIFAVAEP